MLAMIPLQATPWFPTWATTIWILGVGIAAGLAVSLIVLVVLAILSRLPVLGTLPENPRAAAVLASLVSLGFAALAVYKYWPVTEAEYRGLLVLPIAFLSMLLGWGVVYAMWRRTVSELVSILTEGAVGWIFGSLVAVMIVGLGLTYYAEDTGKILSSLKQYNWLDDGLKVTRHPVPGNSADVDPDDAPFRKFIVPYVTAGVEQVVIESDRTIIIGDAEFPKEFQRPPTRIDPDTPFEWKRGELNTPPLSLNSDDGVWIQNREIDEATVVFSITSQPPVRQVSTIVTTAGAVIILVFGLIAFRQAMPRLAAIALATAKSEMAQPLYFVLLICGAVALLLFAILPFNTLGEDIKVLKDNGMTLIMVLGMGLAVWSAGTSVAEEIEGRTALTVLSKPVSRRSFLIGKYAGIMLSVLVMFVMLGIVLMLVTAYKPIFEARENSIEVGGWRTSHMEMVSLVPGLILYFMETMAIAAVGVALATRLSMLANFVTCAVIYVVGNLTSPLVASADASNPFISFTSKLIAVVVPNLNTFNVQAAVDVGNPVPPIYLAGAFNYLVCFGILTLMVALLMFEDRDLA